MLLSATSRKSQLDADLQPVQQSMPLSETMQKGQSDADLHTIQDPGLSATNREGQSNADLQPAQNPEHTLVSNEQKGQARCWLTACSKPKHAFVSNKQSQLVRCRLTSYPKARCFSSQQQIGKANQMLTYSLFKTQTMLLSTTRGNGQPNSNLHTVQSPEHALVSNKQAGPARCWLTACSTSKACSCQEQVGKASQMLTYFLLKTQSMLFSATTRKVIQMLTYSLFKTLACFCQQQVEKACKMLSYILFKSQRMLLSATMRRSQPDAGRAS